MNYKDIVKRLKGFDFSKKQKENLADIIDNNSPIYIEINKKEKTTTIFGKAYPLDISNSSWFATIIKDNDLFYYFKNNIGKPIKFILKEIEPGGIFVEDAAYARCTSYVDIQRYYHPKLDIPPYQFLVRINIEKES